MNPLKQGLKLLKTTNEFKEGDWVFIHESIKTRVETATIFFREAVQKRLYP